MPEINADFKGVHARSDYEGGPYTFDIKEAKPDNGPSGLYVRLSLQFVGGKYEGLFTEEIVSFAPKALWKSKQFLEAVGYEVPDGPFRFDTKDLIGLRFKATTEREVDPTGKYQPKLRITEFHNKDKVLAPEGSPAATAGSGATEESAAPTDGAAAPVTASPAVTPASSTSRPKVKV